MYGPSQRVLEELGTHPEGPIAQLQSFYLKPLSVVTCIEFDSINSRMMG